MPIFTRKPKPRALVASAARISLKDSEAVNRELRRVEARYARAWQMFDEVGEIKHAGYWAGNSLARLRIFVARRPNLNDDPEEVNEPKATAILERLVLGSGGFGALMKSIGVQLFVVGEGYLVGIAERPDIEEEWAFVSRDDLKNVDGKVHVSGVGAKKDDDPKVHVSGVGAQNDDDPKPLLLDPDNDFWARIWQPHPQSRLRADSSVFGVLEHCEELLAIERAVRAHARSRIANTKIFYVANEMSFGNTDPSTNEAGDGEGQDDPLTEELITAFITPIRDEGSASAVAPIIIRGPAQYADSLRVVDVGREMDEQFDQRTSRALQRIAQGLLQPAEVQSGLGMANHWGAGEVQKSAALDYTEPLAILAVSGLTSAYFRPALREEGLPDDLFIWFEEIETAMDEEPAEEPVPEAVVMASSSGLVRLGAEETARKVSALIAANALPLGKRLHNLDRTLQAKVAEACESTLRQALERTGSRIANKARSDPRFKDKIKGLSPAEVAILLGQEGIESLADIGNLLTDSIDALQGRFDRLVAQTQSQALALVPRMTKPGKAAVALQQGADRLGAWVWLRQALRDLGKALMFNPSPNPPDLGEFDASMLVPFGVVREALARAGGAASSAAVTASVASKLSGIKQALGVATGWLMRATFEEKGVSTLGYVWEYGEAPRTRPFEPHEGLDSEAFTDFEDPGLTNLEGWPPTSHYYPGDHNGCSCDFSPLMEDANG